MELDFPKKYQAEITLIGTGGGYGECVVAHLGNNNWIIVDSCINPETKAPLALEYLSKLNVDLKKDVKLVLCTHWHDDHIKGISIILKECTNASFAMLRINDIKKFCLFLSFDNNKELIVSQNVSTSEFYKVLEIIKERNIQPQFASCDRILYSNRLDEICDIEVISLSPSDFSIMNFDREITNLLKEFSLSNKKIVPELPNSKSVVLLLKLGTHCALLGADLEVHIDDRIGWLSILNNSQSIRKKSSYFKISHHGSENGYHRRIWDEIIGNSPVATLTPWNISTKLPTIKMLQKYCVHTDKLYMTSPVVNSKPKKRSWDEMKMIEKLGYKLTEVKYNKGIIRSRINLSDNNAIWETLLLDSAFHVNAEFQPLGQ